MPYNRYLLIKRWRRDTPPDSIRQLTPGTEIKLLTGETHIVDHVGLGRVLLNDLGWVDWREIELPSAEG